MQYLHGDRARADFEKACRDWAARWADDFQPDTGVKDATCFDDPIPDDIADVDPEKPTKLVAPDEDALSSRTADSELRKEETN